MLTEPKPLILIVDDDVDSAFLVGRLLAKSGIAHDALHLVDGERAIQYLDTCEPHGQNSRPAVVLLDIKMPKVNGLEVLAWMRADPNRAVPVIIMTTSDDPRDQELARRYEADAFLAKFPTPELMRELLSKILGPKAAAN